RQPTRHAAQQPGGAAREYPSGRRYRPRRRGVEPGTIAGGQAVCDGNGPPQSRDRTWSQAPEPVAEDGKRDVRLARANITQQRIGERLGAAGCPRGMGEKREANKLRGGRVVQRWKALEDAGERQPIDGIEHEECSAKGGKADARRVAAQSRGQNRCYGL